MLVPFLIGIFIFVMLLVFWSLQKNENTNIVNPFWEKFQTMFIESADDDYWSSNRFSYVVTMFISNFVMWGAIIYLVAVNGEFPVIPEGVIYIYGISNGIVSMAKVWQKKEERLAEKLENNLMDEEE